MAAYAVQMPSGSVNGAPVLLTGSNQTLHTAVAGTTQADEVYIWIANVHATVATTFRLTINGIIMIDMLVPAQSQPFLVLAGTRHNNGHVIQALAGAVSSIVAIVNTNRITL